MSDLDEDEDIVRLQKHVDELMEHYDSVLILVTRHDVEAKGTLEVDAGGGNFYARLGMVEEWLEKQRQRIREKVKKETMEDDDE